MRGSANAATAAPTVGAGARRIPGARGRRHCGECHTPRGMTQALDNSRFLAGNPKGKGPEGSEVPNITPDHGHGHREVDRRADHHLHRHRQSSPMATSPAGSWARSFKAAQRVQGHDQGGSCRHRPLPQVDPRDQEQDRGLTAIPQPDAPPDLAAARPAKESQMRRASRGVRSRGPWPGGRGGRRVCERQRCRRAARGDIVADRQRLMKLHGASSGRTSRPRPRPATSRASRSTRRPSPSTRSTSRRCSPRAPSPRSPRPSRIWQKWPEFEAAAKKMETEAEKLRDASKAKNAAAHPGHREGLRPERLRSLPHAVPRSAAPHLVAASPSGRGR